ncbi:plasmid mobilization relaxosome protein MobC [Ruminococcus sp. 5_1_39BFAA]|uniref:plasmid mobilization protein n=1 Tax=Ruminococcus sp. 5_1_39BFAA TaxID=457412 RepID=UPI0035628672
MARLTCKKEFRCTAEEAAWIEKCARQMDMTESTYMRYRLREKQKIRMPPDIKNLLQELKYYDLKIGTNINQIVRSCNSKRFITQADYQKLVEYLTLIDRKYQETLDRLQEVLDYGGDKAPED